MKTPKPGYQLVPSLFDEFYEIPNEWGFPSLNEIIKKNPKTVNPFDFPDEDFELFSIPAYHETKKPIIEKGKKILSTKFKVENDYVLFGKLNPDLPKIWFVSSKSKLRKISSSEFIPLIGKSNMDSKYLYYLAWSEFLYGKCKSFVTGTTNSRERVDPKLFRKLKVPIPEIKEQERIAGILSNVDSLIDNNNSQIEKEQIIKNAFLNKLFVEGVKNESLEKKTLSPRYCQYAIPKKWKIKPLEKLLSILRDGTHTPPPRTEFGIPLLSAENIHDGIIDFDFEISYISEEDYKKIHVSYEIEINDLLLTIIGASIGRISKVPKMNKFSLQRSVAILRTNEQLTPDYLFYFMHTDYFQRQLIARSNATAQAGVYLGEIGKIPIFYPELPEEQTITTNIFNNINSKLENLSLRGLEFENLKKGLMQKLLTGEIRVKV